MFCGNCGKMVDDGAAVCPHCGAPTGADAGAPAGGGYGGRSGGYAGGGYDDYNPKPVRRAPRQTSELGISTALLAALVFWSGLVGLSFGSMYGSGLLVLLTGGYVLIREKDQWVRAMALKAIAIVIIFAVLLGFFSLFGTCENFILDIVNMIGEAVNKNGYYDPVRAETLNDIIRLLQYVVVFLQDLFLLLAGFAALGGKNFRVPVADSIVNRHLGRSAK